SEFYSVSLWGVCLFLAGAYFASHYVHDILPDGWPKELRFASIVLSAGSVGGILAYFAIHIRILFWLWLIIGWCALLGLDVGLGDCLCSSKMLSGKYSGIIFCIYRHKYMLLL
ncbi:MAG: hypothetical protein KAJ29_07370, partial [Alphaproteobacteria bacterium]|nr:hypothetical protein [Alphaproteobacteria bacterium]